MAYCFGLFVTVAEDLDADQADDAGDGVAVFLEVAKGLVATLHKVTLAAVDEGQEVLLRNTKATDHGAKREARLICHSCWLLPPAVCPLPAEHNTAPLPDATSSSAGACGGSRQSR